MMRGRPRRLPGASIRGRRASSWWASSPSASSRRTRTPTPWSSRRSNSTRRSSGAASARASSRTCWPRRGPGERPCASRSSRSTSGRDRSIVAWDSSRPARRPGTYRWPRRCGHDPPRERTAAAVYFSAVERRACGAAAAQRHYVSPNPMRQLALIPHDSLGPVKLGSPRDEVRRVLGPPSHTEEPRERWGISFPAKDCFIDNALQVSYDEDQVAEFIEASRHDSFVVTFDGVPVHTSPAEEVLATIRRHATPDENDREYPWNQSF